MPAAPAPVATPAATPVPAQVQSSPAPAATPVPARVQPLAPAVTPVPAQVQPLAPAATPVPARVQSPAPAPAPVAVRRPAPPAPSRPRPQAPAPSWDTPRRTQPSRGRSRDEIGWVKAHGGAGVSSLVEVVGGVDVGSRWPEPARGEPRRVMLVGRSSARGMRSVSQALGAFEEGKVPPGLELLGVVLVADAPGRLPLALLRRIRVLRSATHVHRVPWIPAWRTGGQPKVLPRQLSTLADLVGATVHEGPTS